MKEINIKNKILLILKNSDDYISGEELSQYMGISRTAIWKHINTLRSEGYNIDSITKKGYKLTNNNNIINEVELTEGLQTKNLGKSLIFMQKVDSTNNEIKRLAQKEYPNGTTVVAESQSSGKGRLGRLWSSPNGTGLWFSFLLRPQIPPNQIAGITLATGLGVCKAIRNFIGVNALIKWPNDIIIANKKLCGILTEMAAESDRIEYAVVGIGINVNTIEFPEEIQHKATSLFIETQKQINRAELFKNILFEVEKYIEKYLSDNQMDIIDEYKKLCATLGRKVTVTRGKHILSGTAISINNEGELIVKKETGEEIYVNSGEVTVQGIY